MSANPPSRPKPPHDYFSWMYWIPFLLVVPTVATWMANKPIPPPLNPQVHRVIVPFLTRELPAYRVIMPSDMFMGTVDANTVGNKTVRELQDLIGHYTLVPILPDRPILENQIGPKPDPRMISNTLAVAIPANSTTTIGGNLHAGDIVSMAAVPLSNTTSLPKIVFDAVLVLDVKTVGDETVIILAIPAYRWPNYLVETRDATLVFARQVTDQ
jgi:Flp pilus assembly protein CpaB